MKMLFCINVIFPLLMWAQPLTTKKSNKIATEESGEKGVCFEKFLNWQQVLAKAKTENKYIFVDCFATWCGPCRKMDLEIFPNDSLGDYMNNKFISIKVQMDKTEKDDEWVRGWYRDAIVLSRKYKVTAFPTYFIFSPNGDIVSKEDGYKRVNELIAIASNAMAEDKKYNNPYELYDYLITNYNNGKKDFAMIPYMIKTSQKLRDTEVVNKLTVEYSNYLSHLKDQELYTKDNIEFIASNIKMLKQKYLQLFFPNGKRADSIMNKSGYSTSIVDNLIRKEKVNNFLNAAQGGPEPEWEVLTKAIEKEYNKDYAERNVLFAKVKWHKFYKNLSEYAKYFILQVEKYGTDTTSDIKDNELNVFAYEVIFKYSNDKAKINKSIKWMEGVVRRFIKRNSNPACYPIDTYACLLYKNSLLFNTGHIQEAIQWEERAIKDAEKWKQDKSIPEYEATIIKMKKGDRIWENNNFW